MESGSDHGVSGAAGSVDEFKLETRSTVTIGKNSNQALDDHLVTRKTHVFLKVGVLTAVWWATSALFSANSKKVLRRSVAEGTDPFLASALVTTFQLLGSAILAVAMAAARGKLFSLRNVCRAAPQIGTLHGLGNYATNLLVVLSGVSGALTYKALEPFFVILALRVLDLQRYNKEITWMGLFWILFVCVGVGIASYHPPFIPAVLVSAMLCNSMFGARTVLIKKFRQASDEGSKDAEMLNIFFSTCVVGFAVVGCLTLVTMAVHDSDEILLAFELACCFATLSSSIYYFTYNLVSFLALDYVTAPSHALLKTGKGLTVLVVAGLFLNEEYSVLQWFGLYLAMLGVTLFSHSKEFASPDVGVTMQYWTSAARRAGGTTILAGAFCSAFYGLRDGGGETAASIPTLSVRTGASSSASRFADANMWLTCLSAVRELQYTSLQDIFARDDILASGVLVADHLTTDGVEGLAAEQGTWDLLRDLGKDSEHIVRCHLDEAATAAIPWCDDPKFSKHKLVLSLGREGSTDRKRRGSLDGRLELVEFALRRKMTFLALPRSLAYTKKDTIRKDATRLRQIIASTIGLENAMQNVIFTWRSRTSYELALRYFGFVDNRFVPDSTLHMAPLLPSTTFASASLQPVDLLFVWQLGGSGGQFDRYRTEQWIQATLDALPDGRGNGVTFRLTDWEAMASWQSELTWASNSELSLARIAAMISSGHVIVTNHLEGSLLALLARKPHIIIGNTQDDILAARDSIIDTCEANEELLAYRVVGEPKSAVIEAVQMLASPLK